MSETQKVASEILSKLVVHSKERGPITFKKLNNSLCEFGFSLVMILFSLPMSLPLPYPPGLTTIFGLPLFFTSFHLMMGTKTHWIPDWLGKRTISHTTLVKIVEKANPFLEKIELHLHPRLHFISTSLGNKITGFVCFLCSISVVLPILFGNFIPSLGILFMSVGLLRKDGLIILTGMCIGIIGIIVAALFVVFDLTIIEDIVNLKV